MDGVRIAAGWVRELQGRWLGSIGVDWRSADGLQSPHRGPYGTLRELRCAGWRENTQQGTLADRTGASLRGRSVGRMAGQLRTGAVRLGVESLAAVPGRD